MQAKNYAQVILSLGESKLDQVIVHLKKKGLISLLPAILKEIERTLKKREKNERVVLTSAQPLSEAKLKEVKHQHPELFVHHSTVNSTESGLIGGYRIQCGHKVLDVSYKKALFDLYQKIVTSKP